MAARRIRLHRAAAEQREGRQVRDAEVHEPHALAILGREWGADQLTFVEASAFDRRELVARVLELSANDFLRTVDRQRQRPRRAAAALPEAAPAAKLCRAVHDVLVFQQVQRIHQRDDVALVEYLDGRGDISLRPRHQPEAHLGDHAHVALAKQAVDPRAVAPLVLLPRLRVRHGAHAGADDFAVAEHDLHAAMRAEVIAERIRRPAAAAVERVADHAAPARIGRIDPDVEPVLFDVIVEVEVAYARLDERIRVALVDLEHAVHALQIEHDAAGVHGRRAAVCKVAPGRDRIKRNAASVGRAHHGLHFLDGRWSDRGGRETFLGLAPEGGIGVTIEGDVLVGREHPLGADGVTEFLERGAEILLADSGRENGHVRSSQTMPQSAAR